LRRVDADGQAWLDSGDRAYRVGEEIFVTGRVKDIVIRAGRNLYPDEIEQAVGEVNGIRKGCVAAFGVADAASGTERLVVLAEVREPRRTGDAALRDAVASAVVEAIGEPADRIVLAPPHTVLKTSSGKVRRSACRALVESGALHTTRPGAARDWLRLLGGGLAVRAGVLARGIGEHLYALWFSVVFVLLAGPAWLGVATARSREQAWGRAHRAARWLWRASGTSLVVQGLERLPPGRAVLVANHASYLDGFVLLAALPRPLVLVVKEQLRALPVVGRFLARLGCEFVQREDALRSVQGAERMLARLREGASLGVFPEGTFVAGPGLLPLHLGAFLSAARAGVPVVPVAILGTRQFLPANRLRPRRAALAVCIDAPIGAGAGAAAADLFASAARLREAARQALVRLTAQQDA
jgi:1-acyl-sn-glycerol-3-phosphate acyltransferase